MMDCTFDSVFGLHKPENKDVILIEEQVNIDGSFVLCGLLEKIVKRDERIIFVLFHQVLGHYHGIGVKLGYNLLALKQEGKLQVVDFLKDVSSDDNTTLEDKLKLAFTVIQEAAAKFSKEGPVTIILEHPSDIIITGGNSEIVFLFAQYVRRLVKDGVKLICLTKTLPECHDLTAFANSLHHQANLYIQVRSLTTGSASDITGMVVIVNREENETLQENKYHYQLMDKRIRFFAPGLVHLR